MALTSNLAEGTSTSSGGISPMMIVLVIMFVGLIFMMFRNKKKAAAAEEKRGEQLVPGAKIMTNAGIFGQVVAVDKDENKVVIEVAPGMNMTVHLKAITTFLDEPAPAPADSPADAAAASGELDTETPSAPEFGELKKPAAGDEGPETPQQRS